MIIYLDKFIIQFLTFILTIIYYNTVFEGGAIASIAHN